MYHGVACFNNKVTRRDLFDREDLQNPSESILGGSEPSEISEHSSLVAEWDQL